MFPGLWSVAPLCAPARSTLVVPSEGVVGTAHAAAVGLGAVGASVAHPKVEVLAQVVRAVWPLGRRAAGPRWAFALAVGVRTFALTAGSAATLQLGDLALLLLDVALR